MVAPRCNAGASATTVGVSALVGVVLVQWISPGVGGFLAGRLRDQMVGLHTHEVFFRDTAHGFMAWAAAGVAGVLVFTSGYCIGRQRSCQGGERRRCGRCFGVPPNAAQHAGAMEPSGYSTHSLFRFAAPAQGD